MTLPAALRHSPEEVEMCWTSLALVLMLGLGSWGCGGGGDASDEAPADADASGEAAQESPVPAGRDLSSVDVCTLIPAEAVAKGMGEEPAAAPTNYDPGFEGKGCRYRSGRRYAEISLLPPGEFDFKRRMTPKERVHPLEGLGDAAYWEDDVDRMELYVLKTGDATIWIRFQDRANATQVDEARRLGEAVLASLK
jgi:hypothetical protein